MQAANVRDTHHRRRLSRRHRLAGRFVARVRRGAWRRRLSYGLHDASLFCTVPLHWDDVLWETKMLSPHEFATLMLVRQAPDQIDMNRAELDALLERQLVMLEHCAAGARRAYLTEKGKTFLDALHPSDTPRRSRQTADNGG
ncbi:hypothetical protein ABIC49_005332 [Burkholderia ambifaria]